MKSKNELINEYLKLSVHSPYDSGIRNPGNFSLWNPDSTTLESGIQLMESGIQPLESRIQLVRNPACCDCSRTTFLLRSDYCVKISSCEEVQ